VPPFLGVRHAWLSLTPEPEKELPAAIAALRNGAVEEEQARMERLILRGSRRAWNTYIADALELARNAPPSAARDLVLDVIDNHDNLKLGLE
jgi:hypothetical protein